MITSPRVDEKRQAASAVDDIYQARGHIGGTSTQDVLGSVENRRDLSRRSEQMYGASAKVVDVPAPDPAYRPGDHQACQSKGWLLYAELLPHGDSQTPPRLAGTLECVIKVISIT